MVRIVKCPVCSKINKVKHSHYNHFVCCSTKFPIEEYQINKIHQNNLKEPECESNVLEIEDNSEEPVEVSTINPDNYEFMCSECKELFNREGNLNGRGGITCPGCGEDYDL